MKALKEEKGNKVDVSVKINGRKAGEFKVHTNDPLFNPRKVADCINNPKKCSDKMTKELVLRVTKNLSFQIVNILLWKKGKIEQILSDAFELAQTAAVEEEIISMQLQLVPMIERIYDPVKNALNSSDISHSKPYKTYEQILSVLFGATFMDLGIITFSAKVEN